MNPREYADPRKHGPEYQERARRAATRAGGETRSADRSTAPPGPLTAEPGPTPEPRAVPDPGPARPTGGPIGPDVGPWVDASPASAPGGGALTVGLAAGGLVAIPSFAVLLSSEMAGDAGLAATALVAPPLAAIAVSTAVIIVRRLRRA